VLRRNQDQKRITYTRKNHAPFKAKLNDANVDEGGAEQKIFVEVILMCLYSGGDCK
jgi:hypothetical protein